jgi:hypothetical protein
MRRKVIALIVGGRSSQVGVRRKVVKFGNALGSIHDQSP